MFGITLILDINNNNGESMSKGKIKKGQFFTKGNPFVFPVFQEWLYQYALKNDKNAVFIEPFAGSNSIIKLFKEANPDLKNKWVAFDIEPESVSKNVTDIPIEKRDMLKRFPKGYNIGITNPPYLAKNSAKRKNIRFSYKGFDDLYKYSLHIMLKNLDYVAAIIPESFIVQNLFHERLFAVVSLRTKMFEDTECPVCLALFIPAGKKILKDNFKIYSNEEYIGDYQSLITLNKKSFLEEIPIVFHDPKGQIALHAIDNTFSASIVFQRGEIIPVDKVKKSNRSFTRIGGLEKFSIEEIDLIINISNDLLSKKRRQTNDVFLTSFKGLRKDGFYRRRLDFTQAREILTEAVHLFNKRVQ